MNRGSLKRRMADAIEERADAAGFKSYRCLANVEFCKYEQKTFNAANFKRHFLACHKDVASRLGLVDEAVEKLKEPSYSSKKRPKLQALLPLTSPITIQHDRRSALMGSLLMVTENNLPISYPNWTSTQLLVAPVWKAYNMKVTSNTLPTIISRAVDIMRTEMSELFRNKLICLKIDSGTRLSRAIFAINVTAHDDEEEIEVYHLGKYS